MVRSMIIFLLLLSQRICQRWM